MKTPALAVLVIAAALGAPAALAQVGYEPAAAPSYPAADAAFSDAELDQVLAPVALYPDELLSQILMAATYPLEVVEAARWSRAHPDLLGEDAVAAVDSQDWDPSVKSLVAFPQVLQQMDAQLDWTQRLGEAFLAQQDGVMASVQRLRRAAMDAGNLSSTDEIVVTREGSDIALDSPSPEMVYVPYYDPRVAYGTWWSPSYPPVWWSPWPGYYYGGGYGLGWSVGIPVGIDFFYGDFDWRRHHVRLHDHHPFYERDHDRDARNWQWRHDPHHRRDVQYRNPVARREFGGSTTPRPPHNVRTRPQGQQPASPVARPDRGPFPQQRPQSQVQPRNQWSRTPSVQQPVARPSAPQPAQPLARPYGAPARIAPRDMGPIHAAPQTPRPAPQAHVPQPAQPIARQNVPRPAPQVHVAPRAPQAPVAPRPAPQVHVAPPPAAHAPQPAHASDAPNPLAR